MKKKIISSIFILLGLLCLWSKPISTYAAEDKIYPLQTNTTNNQNNQSFRTAEEISSNTYYSSFLASTQDKDYFKFYLNNYGLMVLHCYNNTDFKAATWKISLFKEDGYDKTTYLDEITLGNGTYTAMDRKRLAPGTYYVVVENQGGNNNATNQNYQFMVGFQTEDSGRYEQEMNDSFDTANVVNLNTNYTGNMNTILDKDYFKFSTWNAGSIQIQFTNPIRSNDDWKASLYWLDNTGGKTLVDQVNIGKLSSITMGRKRLPAGTYYLLFEDNNTVASYANQDYQFQVNHTTETNANAEQEFNNSYAQANYVNMNVTYTGNLNTIADQDYYKFAIYNTTSINLRFLYPNSQNQYTFRMSLLKEDSYGNRTSVQEYIVGNQKDMNYPINGLSSGTYYLVLKDYEALQGFGNDDYQFNISLTTETNKNVEKEDNGYFDKANAVSFNTTYTGDISSYFDYDYFKFTTNNSGKVVIDFMNTISYQHEWMVTLYKETNQGYRTWMASHNLGKLAKQSMEYQLQPGTYYFVVQDYAFNLSYLSDPYQFKINFAQESSSNNEQENNGSFQTANTVALDVTYTGNLSNQSDQDYYKINYGRSGELEIKFTNTSNSYANHWNLLIYKEDSVGNRTLISENKVGSYGADLDFNVVSTEKYYIVIMDNEKVDGFSTANYQLRIEEDRDDDDDDKEEIERENIKLKHSRKKQSIKLTWNSDKGVSYYEIYRSKDKYGYFELIGTVYKSNYTDQKVTSKGNYYYKVRAIYTDGEEGEFSNLVSVNAKKGPHHKGWR